LWGIVLVEQERYEEAIHNFNHSLIYSENKYDALYYLAFCYLKLENHEFAISMSEQAIEADCTKIDPYIILAEAYLQTCRESLCLDTFRRAEENCETNGLLYTNWGIALQKYDFADEAREKLYRALLDSPNNEIVLFNLGINFLMTKEFTQAEEFFEKVLEFNPKHAQALFNLATLQFNKNNFDVAVELYKKAYEADKKSRHIYFNIANSYYQKLDMENAEYYFKKCIEYCPSHMQAYINYANLLADCGNLQDAERKARTAYMLDRKNSYANFAFGIILLKLAKFREAKEKFENAADINPEFNAAYLGIVESAANLGQYTDALNALGSVQNDFKAMPEFLYIQDGILDSIAGDEAASPDLLNYACEYCNKFLELYNNDKVLVVRDILLKKLEEQGKGR
jgi:tetratricopeptide (TPR) repeat protein